MSTRRLTTAQALVAYLKNQYVERDGQQRSTPICEIELELKHGEVGALHSLADVLRERIPNLTADNVSKAQRGYQLYNAAQA